MVCFGFIVCFFFAGLLVGAAGVLEWIAVRVVRWILRERGARTLREPSAK